ncbi:MAG: hypothetical protein NUV48_07185 [Peptococcaceae bacterium]|nr:hypothetical protein [Peptococcaceae bacterium]
MSKSFFVDGVEIVNTTPHLINFLDSSGDVLVIPCSGVVINARAVESDAGERGLAKLVKTSFIADPESEKALSLLEAEHPGAIIVGSIIAAQAFPGRVFAMTPAPGFERVPPQEKRMNPRKFTTF